MKFLIVEDSLLMARVLENLIAGLPRAGEKEIAVYGNAEGALAFLEKANPHPSSLPNLIILDLELPGQHGLEFLKILKGHPVWRSIPVIMISAAEESEHLEKAFEAGAVDYISKPIRRFELLARVKSTLILKFREHELSRKNTELENAFKEIKVLQGFIPVCAWCRKIRDMKGSWHQMEIYIQEHSLAKFSHGICENCAGRERTA